MAEGSLSGWTEGILFSLAFVVVLGLIVSGMNGLYNKDNDIGLGVNTTADKFINYQDTASEKISGGEADFNSLSGITLKSSWGLTKEVFNIVGSFITGGWIEDIFRFTKMGEAGQVIGRYLRILWFISLVFAILYILFKVVA